jgi:hypothetical protein
MAGDGNMKTNIYCTARELMNKWNTDAIGLYNHIEDGLPAYLGSNRISHRQIRLYDPGFEKWMCRLRFWKRHVELWEIGGPEALAEGTRLRFPSMGDSPTAQLPAALSPPPLAEKERRPKYHKAKQKFKELYLRALKHDPGKPFRWYLDYRIRPKGERPKVCKSDGKPFSDNTYYQWKKEVDDSLQK